MSRPPEAVIRRTQNQLRRQGKPCDFYAACSELGRRGGQRRAISLRQLTMPTPDQGRSCLPPGDRD